MLDIVNIAPESHLSAAASASLQKLQDEVNLHQKSIKEESYLARGIDFLYRADKHTYAAVESLKQKTDLALRQGDYKTIEALSDEVNRKVEKDHDKLALQKDIEFWGASGLKVGAIMMSGGVGLAATAALYAADQARPADQISNQALDAGLGVAKGLVFRGLIGAVMGQSVNFAAKGAELSIGSRASETLLTRGNYYDAMGHASLYNGLGKTFSETLNWKHLAVDGAVLGLAMGAGIGVAKAAEAGGIDLAASPFWSRIAASTTWGASSGAVAEVAAAEAAGETISVKRVAEKALLGGAIFGVAAVPGALQADGFRGDNKAVDSSEGQFRQYKKQGTVQAEQLKADMSWTTSKGEVMQAAAGDWKITGADGSTWSVKPDIFASTYSPVSGKTGVFAKTAITNAQQLTRPITVQTLEGQGSGQVGDYLVKGPQGELYVVPKAKFESMYKQV